MRIICTTYTNTPTKVRTIEKLNSSFWIRYVSARADLTKPIIMSGKSLLQNAHRTDNFLSLICSIRHTAQTHRSGNKLQFLKKNKWMWTLTLTFALTKETDKSSHKCTHKIIIQLQFGKTKCWVGAILLGWICKTHTGYCFGGILLFCYLVALYLSTVSNLFRNTGNTREHRLK